jgi:hypothetical protein
MMADELMDFRNVYWFAAVVTPQRWVSLCYAPKDRYDTIEHQYIEGVKAGALASFERFMMGKKWIAGDSVTISAHPK